MQDEDSDEDSEDSGNGQEVPPYIDVDGLEREWLVALPLLRRVCNNWEGGTAMTTADVAQYLVLHQRNAFPNVVRVVCCILHSCRDCL